MRINFSQCYQCGEPVDPQGEFGLLLEDEKRVLYEPEVITPDGNYIATHIDCG